MHSSLVVVYLIFFGPVVAFTAPTYLISHVSKPLVMSYADVNPTIAVIISSNRDELIMWR